MSASPPSLLECCYSPRASTEGLWVFRYLSLISFWASIFIPQNYNPKKSSAVFFSHFLFLSFYNLEISNVLLRKPAESQAQFSIPPFSPKSGSPYSSCLGSPRSNFYLLNSEIYETWANFSVFYPGLLKS